MWRFRGGESANLGPLACWAPSMACETARAWLIRRPAPIVCIASPKAQKIPQDGSPIQAIKNRNTMAWVNRPRASRLRAAWKVEPEWGTISEKMGCWCSGAQPRWPGARDSSNPLSLPSPSWWRSAESVSSFTLLSIWIFQMGSSSLAMQQCSHECPRGGGEATSMSLFG